MFRQLFSFPQASPQRHSGYSPSMTPAEKEAWLQSPEGQNFLFHRPRLQQLYAEGKLIPMLRNPSQAEYLDQWLVGAGGKGGGRGRGGKGCDWGGKGGKGKGRGGRGHGGMRNGNGNEIQYCTTTSEINDEDRLSMLCDGFIVLSGVVPEHLCRTAQKFINMRIGEQSYPSKNDFTLTNDPTGKLSSSISSHSAVMSLLYASPLASIVDSLLHHSDGNCTNLQSVRENINVRGCQIAIRFPEEGDPPANGLIGGVQWHIDGMDKGDHSPFTLLVGVAISNQLDVFMGNLCLFPGSHHEIVNLCDRNATGQVPIIPVIPNKPILKEPTQVLLRAGDAVLCHQKLPHRGGPNYSPEVRLMVYFRVAHRDHAERKQHCLDNLWIEYDGIDKLS